MTGGCTMLPGPTVKGSEGTNVEIRKISPEAAVELRQLRDELTVRGVRDAEHAAVYQSGPHGHAEVRVGPQDTWLYREPCVLHVDEERYPALAAACEIPDRLD